MEEIKEYFKQEFNRTVISTLEKMIKYEFPDIKGLSITKKEDGMLNVEFDGGNYTHNQVLNKINEYRDNSIHGVRY